MTDEQLIERLATIRALPKETEWVEFKQNWFEPEQLGEYMSALSNSARIHGKSHGYMAWGVEDVTHAIVGTTFKPSREKVGKGHEELEPWLARQLTPHIEFKFFEFVTEGVRAVLLLVAPCTVKPTAWREATFIRVGSHKQKLREYPEKERLLWAKLEHERFEGRVALADVPD